MKTLQELMAEGAAQQQAQQNQFNQMLSQASVHAQNAQNHLNNSIQMQQQLNHQQSIMSINQMQTQFTDEDKKQLLARFTTLPSEEREIYLNYLRGKLIERKLFAVTGKSSRLHFTVPESLKDFEEAHLSAVIEETVLRDCERE